MFKTLSTHFQSERTLVFDDNTAIAVIATELFSFTSPRCCLRHRFTTVIDTLFLITLVIRPTRLYCPSEHNRVTVKTKTKQARFSLAAVKKKETTPVPTNDVPDVLIICRIPSIEFT